MKKLARVIPLKATEPLWFETGLYALTCKLPGYHRPITALQAVAGRDSARVLQRTATLTAAQHQALSDHLRQRAIQWSEQYSRNLERAARETFHRPWRFTDYRISAIGSDQFSEAHKNQLRFLAHSITAAHTLGIAHWLAAGHRTYHHLRTLTATDNRGHAA